ncbi:MAG: tRNA1(Val) (adenine(37)-N6)-methyltransferase [Hyphomicrobiaceae bacterium hypho_1]
MDYWPELTDDAFLTGAIKVLQPKKGYRAGIDPVLLAASLDIQDNEHANVLDVGAGVGVAGLSVATRCLKASVTLVEKQKVLAEIARHNITRNRFGDRMDVKQIDLLAIDAGRTFYHSNGRQYFDHVISNPPFYDTHVIQSSKNILKADSNSMLRGALKNWIKFMAEATRPGGSATVIHLAEKLGEILQHFSLYYGSIHIQILYPREHEKANRILVRGTRGSNAPLQINPGIVLHKDNNKFNPEVEQVLRSPTAWPIWSNPA